MGRGNSLDQGLELSRILTTEAPVVSIEAAERVAGAQWGIRAAAQPLHSERDQNFHLSADGGEEYVLKIANPAEDARIIDFQTKALLHIAAADDALPVPRIVRMPNGASEFLLDVEGSGICIVRLLTYLPGTPLHLADRTSAQRRALGRCLGRLGLALKGFRHPNADYDLLWDIKRASRLRPLLIHVEDDRRRALLHRVMDGFEQNALPVLPGLRAQVIHNDFNPHNILVASDDHDRIAGIIDFGDMVHAPLVNEVAVAAAYQLSDTAVPLKAAAELVAGFNSVLPLEAAEIDILFDLILVRLVTSVAISGWRAARYPENRDYLLRNSPIAWAALERLAVVPRAEAQEILRRACLTET
jgi:Ser/Thr protein kinase RdoA (MazF antagonist)